MLVLMLLTIGWAWLRADFSRQTKVTLARAVFLLEELLYRNPAVDAGDDLELAAGLATGE